MKDVIITGNTIKEIVEAVKKICKSLKGAKITALIPKGIEVIEDGAFSDCSGLTEITIPDSVTHIGHQALERCTGLTSITIPAGVKTIYSLLLPDMPDDSEEEEEEED